MDLNVDEVITGAEVASLFDSRSEETLNSDERVILASLLTRDDRVDLAVPDTMDPRELWDTLNICARVFVRVRRASGQLKLLIGRSLLVIQNTPEVYESRGFRSFDAFMSDTDRGLPKITGISRAELFKAKSVAGSVGPDMNLEDARQVGFTKLQLIAGVTDPGSTTQKALIDAAKTDTIPELRERIARSGVQFAAGDLEWDMIQLSVTKTQKKMFQEFVNNPQVRAYCESESPGMIVQRMIEEVGEEWRIQSMVIEGEAREI